MSQRTRNDLGAQRTNLNLEKIPMILETTGITPTEIWTKSRRVQEVWNKEMSRRGQ
jgi:hypothetical protein